MKTKGGRDGPRVLVVDDEPVVLHSLALVLDHAGYSCIPCESGSRAVETLTGDTPLDLALVDLVLPDIPGEEVLAEARRLRPGLPLVAMSGFGRGAAPEQGPEMAFDAFLAKPFERQALLAKIRDLVGCRQA
ncbi:MAG: response regulator [Acidobacteriota bacterium]|nr:response regulator [Acidobacteriota bacterium]